MNSRCGCLLLVLASALLVSGCKTSVEEPLKRSAVEVPPRWTAMDWEASEAAVPAAGDWIHQIGGRPLEELVDEALRHNRDLAAGSARVRQAAAQARLAGAGRWPEMAAEFSASRSKSVTPNPFEAFPGEDGDTALPELLETQITRYGLAANVSWEADLWSRLGDSARAAGATYVGAEAEFAGARLALAGEVARQWLDYVEGAKQLALAERVEENFRAQERLMERRFDAGLTSALDVRLSRTSSRSAAAEVAARRQQVDGIARALEILLGRYPENSIAPMTEWPSLAPSPQAGIPAEIVRRRPDLRAAEARYTAAVLEHGAARKLRYPRLTLNASAGTASTELGDLLNSDFGVWSLAGGLTAPLFTAGRTSAQIESAEGAELEALEDFASTLLDAYREVETNLAAERLLAEREARVVELVEETARAEEQAWEQYGRGLVDIATVLEAQRRAFDSRRELISVRVQRRMSRVSLYLSLGGDIVDAQGASEAPLPHMQP